MFEYYVVRFKWLDLAGSAWQCVGCETRQDAEHYVNELRTQESRWPKDVLTLSVQVVKFVNGEIISGEVF